MIKHGLKHTKVYRLWKSIKERCYKKYCKDYKHYGGRGIRMSDEFENDVAAFNNYIKTLENYDRWINNEKYSIDRIENDGHYERGNLRFTTKSVQARNTRLYKSNSTGYRGVSYHKRDNRYSATGRDDKKSITLGRFKTLEEAVKCRADYEKTWQ